MKAADHQRQKPDPNCFLHIAGNSFTQKIKPSNFAVVMLTSGELQGLPMCMRHIHIMVYKHHHPVELDNCLWLKAAQFGGLTRCASAVSTLAGS
jgi:hypothetical protein